VIPNFGNLITGMSELMMVIRKISTVWRRKITEPLKGVLTQGLSSQKLALSFAFGITLGIFPVLGVTTILSTLAALIFKLNLAVIQLANYMVYPLQILLLVPYYHLGDLFFNAQQSIEFKILSIILPGSTHKEIITMLLESTLYAIGAWFLVSPLTLALLYAGLKPVLVRLDIASSRLIFIRR
jgi:uncharacterized protein (DUF2062 family)